MLVTANLVEETFHFGLHLVELKEFLLDLESESSEDRDIGERARESFLETFSSNPGKFVQGQKPLPDKGAVVWGRYIKLDNHIEFVVPHERFTEILHAAGFADEQIVLAKWKEAGWIDVDKDGRFTRKRCIVSGVEVRCVVLMIPESELTEPLDRESPEAEEQRQLAAMEDREEE